MGCWAVSRNLAFSIGVGTTLGEMAADITDTESD